MISIRSGRPCIRVATCRLLLSRAHDPALSGIVADVIVAESRPCLDGCAREIVTVRVRGTGFVACLGADEIAPAPLHHWTAP